MTIAAILLAAGRSTRMGANKLLEPLSDKVLVRHVADAVAASRASPMIVVTGFEAERIETALSGCNAQFVYNPEFARGLATSLKAGIGSVPATSSAAIVILGDMPFVTSQMIDQLIVSFESMPEASAVIPTREGEWGNPVLLSRKLFSEVGNLEGDAGARKLLLAHKKSVVEVASDGDAVLVDLDTPEALAKARMTMT
jgi:molybdenum cofactor cytidylyltransferase